MKRSSLRRTAIKRKPRKLGRIRKPLRAASKKRAKRNREVKPFRDAFREEVGHCEICKQSPRLLEVHEIARGPARVRALDKRYALLVLCRECHRVVTDFPSLWSVANQLRVLKESRPGDFDVVAINELLTRRVDERDIA